jgi:glycosyltransferase involved in cell wall biosynthesis
MTLPIVSVIIPHLNQPDLLKRCLTSLQAQTFEKRAVEVIVVDNGSKQLPTEICQSGGNVALLQELAPGPGPARNAGVKTAQADILAFIDADCIAHEDWLASIVNRFSDASTSVIGGDVRIAYENPDNLTALEAYETVFAYQQKNYIEKKGFTGTGNMALRRDVMAVVGPFRGIEVAEDRDWGRRAQNLKISIVYVPEMVVRHPARKTFAELTAKWNRHISHDFEEKAKGTAGKLRWFATALMVAASSILDAAKIFRSARLAGISNRLRASGILFKIRIYRAYGMLQLLASASRHRDSQKWNRR